MRALAPIAGALLIASGVAFACIHPPIAFKGQVNEVQKEALLFHDGELAHLVVRTSLASTGGLPDKMAWVIPLPSLPKKIEVVEPLIFYELFFLTRPPPEPTPPAHEAKKGEPKAAAAAPAPGILVHAARTIGEYTVQPIEILSDTAGSELNAWLAKNGFGGVPPENQRFYLKKGTVFLAIRLERLSGNSSEMRPLHIAYPAPTAWLPLKFSTHSGVFDVTLYTITALEPAQSALAGFHLERRQSVALGAQDLKTFAPTLLKLIGERGGHLTRFQGVGYNRPGKEVAAFPIDPGIDKEHVADAPRSALNVTFAVSDWVLGLVAYAGAFLVLGYVIQRRSRRAGRPWIRRVIAAAAIVALVFFGPWWLVDSYSDYIARSKVSGAVSYVYGARSEITEKALQKKSLSGSGENIAAPGADVSRDGVITLLLGKEFAGADIKIVMRPVLVGEKVEWSCEGYPAAAAVRYAPARCRP